VKNVKKIAYFLFLCLAFQFSYSQWESKNNGIDMSDVGKMISSFMLTGDTIYVITGGGIYFSLNNGEVWQNVGLTVKDYSLLNLKAAITIEKDNIVASFPSRGLYLSTDHGVNWKLKKTSSEYDTTIQAVYISNNNIFAGTGLGVYISTDLGDSWIFKNIGTCASVLAKHRNNIFASGCGAASSFDMGKTWLLNNKGIDVHTSIRAMVSNNNNLFLGNDDGKVYLSTDMGENWVKKSSIDIGITSLVLRGDAIFASVFSGIYLSVDSGNSWRSISGITYPPGLTFSVFTCGDYIFAGTDKGVYRAKLSDLITDVKDSPTPSDEIALFPNPARDYIGIEISEYSGMIEGANYSILNLLGQTMQSGTLAEAGDVQGECRISVESLPTGIYFLILKDSQAGTFVPLKFIKQ